MRTDERPRTLGASAAGAPNVVVQIREPNGSITDISGRVSFEQAQNIKRILMNGYGVPVQPQST